MFPDHMQKLGQELAFEFWGSSGKIHVLPLQNCLGIKNQAKLSCCSCDRAAFPCIRMVCCSLSAVPGADVRTASHGWCAGYATSMIVEAREAASAGAVMALEGGICVLLWGSEGHSIEVFCQGPSEIQSL